MKKGDTVVIIPEYRLIEGNTADRGMQLLGLLQADIGFIRYVGEKRDISAILRSLPSWCSNQITYEIRQMSDHLFGVRINNPYRALHRKVYRASSFDQYGDMLGHLRQASQTQNMWKESKLSGNIPEDVRTNLAEFLVRANQQGVTVFFSWPAFSKTSFEQNRQEIEQLSTQITQILGKKNVLGAPGDFNWNDDAYFDSVYHLSGPAREERTKKLIALLRRAQNPK